MPIAYRPMPVLLTSLVLVLAACGASTATPTPPGPSASPSASPAPVDIEALAQEITAQVEAIRGLEADGPLTVEVIDEAGLVEHITDQFQEDNPTELVEASDGLLTRLGLLPADASLEELYLELLSSQILGLYDQQSETLFVVSRDGGVSALERFTMSHEIDHALQDQAFDLESVIPDATDEGDAALAAFSLIEGDASLLMTQWAIEHMTPAELLEVVEASSDPEQQALLARMPRILADTLQFPYIAGLEFVAGPQDAGGWSAIDAMFEAVPASTEQILHPEKYEAGEAPIDVTLADDLATSMGPGWELGIEDTFGEYQMGIWLEVGGTTAAEAAAAAAGWGGDRMAYLTGPIRAPEASDALVWATEWDRAVDAQAFQQAAGTVVGDGDSPGTVIRASQTVVWVILASDGPSLDLAVAAAGLAP
jgi:hypothetical protein